MAPTAALRLVPQLGLFLTERIFTREHVSRVRSPRVLISKSDISIFYYIYFIRYIYFIVLFPPKVQLEQQESIIASTASIHLEEQI